MFKDNLTFGYVLFVGIPLLILIGTLRAGAGLSAPPAVSGDWTVEPMPNKCAGSLADANPTSLSIYQTGADCGSRSTIRRRPHSPATWKADTSSPPQAHQAAALFCVLRQP